MKETHLVRARLFLPVLLLFFSSLTFSILPAAGQVLAPIDSWVKFSDLRQSLHARLSSDAMRYLEERSARISSLENSSQWRDRQREVRRVLEMLVDFPEREALNPEVQEIIHRETFNCEKIIFQSLPGFYVSGVLLKPKKLRLPAPAILYLSGHSFPSFRAPYYQRVILNLVQKGFIVFAIDPIGQGEMLQYLDPSGKRSRFSSSTGEHSFFADQCFLAGDSAYKYFVWNGIRAIDYLLSREEVDPDRLGVTGLSGGGFQTTQIAAYDERILASAPAAYITSWKRMIQWRGPGDGEQNLPYGLAHGIDYADLIEVRAPKPTLIISTTRDYVPIEGSRETYGEALRAYQAFGARKKLRMVEDDHIHGYTRKTREALYAFFQETLENPGDPTEETPEFFTPEELKITKTGQTLTSLKGKRVFDLNRERSTRLLGELNRERADLESHLARLKKEVPSVSGFHKPEKTESIFLGRIQGDEYFVEKYLLTAGEDVLIPLTLSVPEEVNSRGVILYLNPEGKSAEAESSGEIEYFLRRGFVVAAPDLAGSGEMQVIPSRSRLAYLGVLVDRSITGLLATDIIRVVNFLGSQSSIENDRIFAVAREELCPALLHAAFFEDALSKLMLIKPLISYESMVQNPYYEVDPWEWVPGALESYDLSDLAAALAPRDLLLVDVQDQAGYSAPQSLIQEQWEVTQRAFTRIQAADKFQVIPWYPHQSIEDALDSPLETW